jgi:hypothetical protein
MASYSGMRIKHATLVAATMDTVTLDGDYKQVEVVARDAVSEIYFTVDGPNPTVLGDNTHVLPQAIGRVTVPASAAPGTPTIVKLISAGVPKYSVRGL